MEPSAAPWRVLEDPVTKSADGQNPAGSTPVPARTLPRTAVLTAGAAVLLVIGAFLVAFGTGSAGTVAVEGGAPLASASAKADVPGPAGSGRIVVVEIVGAVDRPGVFRMPAGSRVGDLVAAAGGYGPRVDAGRAARDLNLAAPLKDGDQIRVPSRDDAAGTPRPAASGAKPAGTSAGPVDLNRATAAELDALPGIGPVTAAKIIASRDQQPFVTVDDLRTRTLVGEKTFAQLKDLVTVS